MSIPMIAGLFPYTRGGVTHPPRVTLGEIPVSLEVNPTYRDDLLVLAGDDSSARQLASFGLRVHRVFNDAPAEVHRDTAHKMKHWMCLWALREFGEFLWVDWDTVMFRSPDDAFRAACRTPRTPKFVWIEKYWATVNGGVYYACDEWLLAMERSFSAEVSEPNDELLWRSVLPPDVREPQRSGSPTCKLAGAPTCGPAVHLVARTCSQPCGSKRPDASCQVCVHGQTFGS